MKRQIISIITIVLLALMPTKDASAQQRRNNNNGNGKMWTQLNLTAEQKDQISKLRLEHQKEALNLQTEIKKYRLDIKELLINKNIDDAKVLSLTDKISDLQAKLKKSSINMWLKSYKLLTDEQKQLVRDNFPGFAQGEGRGFMKGKRGFRQGGQMGNRPGMGMNGNCPFNG